MNNKAFLAFIPSDDYQSWHRRPLLEAIKAQCDRSGCQFIVYKRPVTVIQLFKSLFINKTDTVPAYVKALYTLMPMSLASKSKLLFSIFIVWPIYLQVRKYSDKTSLIWFCKPTQYDYLKYLRGKLLFEVYDNYIADHQGDALREKNAFEQSYAEAIEKSHYVFFSNQALFEKTQKKNKVYFPNAVSEALVVNSLHDVQEDQQAEKIVIGFIGVLSDQIDLDVFATLLKQRPQWQVEIVGRVEKNVVERVNRLASTYPQLKVRGSYAYSELSQYIPYFSVGLCPYTDNPFNAYRNPMKIYEFAAFGVPTVVVGCHLDDDQKMYCYQSTPDNVLANIEKAIKAKQKVGDEILKFAHTNTWEKRALTFKSLFLN